jgi:[acyl-carrier-protein] S-malonyltransferase
MERENAAHPGGMRAVLGLTIEEVEEVLAAYQGPGTVVVANHNSQQQIILSGDQEGLEGLSPLCQAKGAKKVLPLKVAGANHSPLVAGAVPDFTACMEQIPFHPPQIPLLFNATAAQEQDPARIRTIMARQIAARVRWYESIQHMYAAGVEVFVELGPGSVLTGMMKKIVPAGSSVLCMQAENPESLEKVSQALISG